MQGIEETFNFRPTLKLKSIVFALSLIMMAGVLNVTSIAVALSVSPGPIFPPA